MKASDYLKMKLQSDRQLAVYGQQGVISTWKAMKGIGSDIYSGVERVSWYSSCLLPRYYDVCNELVSEEQRMHKSILSVFRYHDVIGHMFYLYFEMVINDSKNGNQQGSVRYVDSRVTEIATKVPVGRATRFALALSFAKAFSASDLVSDAVIKRLSRRTPAIVMALQLFGTEQKCALAARQLKTLDPTYYAILYNAQVEMLYYFIESILSDIIKKYQMQFYNNYDELYDYLKSHYHV